MYFVEIGNLTFSMTYELTPTYLNTTLVASWTAQLLAFFLLGKFGSLTWRKHFIYIYFAACALCWFGTKECIYGDKFNVWSKNVWSVIVSRSCGVKVITRDNRWVFRLYYHFLLYKLCWNPPETFHSMSNFTGNTPRGSSTHTVCMHMCLCV